MDPQDVQTAQIATDHALRRAHGWRRPPQWNVSEWNDELRAVANYAMWDAVTKYDSIYNVPFSAYVYQFVLRELWQFYRAEWRFAQRIVNGVAVSDASVRYEEISPAGIDWIENIDLHAAIATLPRLYQRVIEMVYYREMTEREVARQLGITAPSLHRLKERALQMLREKLCGGGGEIASNFTSGCILIIEYERDIQTLGGVKKCAWLRLRHKHRYPVSH